jgi:hypothetical protein
MSKAISVRSRPLRDGPKINIQTKKMEEEIPKPNPTPRKPFSKR